MRIRIAVPEEHVDPGVIDAAAEAVTRLNESMIRSGAGPTSDQLLAMGAIWRPEPPGDEHFDHVGTIAARGWGDCDDWSPARAATLRATGEDPGARVRTVPSGPSTFHAMVERSSGDLETGPHDISAQAGMKPLSQVSGDGTIEVWACDPHDGRIYQGSLAPTVGPISIHCGPQFAVRGVSVVGAGPYWEARCDMPITGSPLVPVRSYVRREGHRHPRRGRRVHGVSVVGNVPYALACIGHGPTALGALHSALCGAVLCGDASELTTSLDRYKVLATQAALTGMPAQQVTALLASHILSDVCAEAAAQGRHPAERTAQLLAELAAEGHGPPPSGSEEYDAERIAQGVVASIGPAVHGILSRVHGRAA